MMNTVILISGNGSNLQAIIDEALINNAEAPDKTAEALSKSKLPINIVAVISNNANAYGLQRARQANLHTEVLDHRQYKDRDAYDAALQQLIEQFNPQLVVLAGFMRILSSEFVKFYLGRLINIHPSLLPQFPGLNTHQQALDAGSKFHGASAHFVTPQVDAGPVIIQRQVTVKENDNVDTLKARVLEQEHIIYPLAIRWFANKRLTLKDNQAYLDGCQLVNEDASGKK